MLWIPGGDWLFWILIGFFVGRKLPKFDAIGNFLKNNAIEFASNGRTQIGCGKGLLKHGLDGPVSRSGCIPEDVNKAMNEVVAFIARGQIQFSDSAVSAHPVRKF